eukprot:4551600-Amphidinium_carterae.1
MKQPHCSSGKTVTSCEAWFTWLDMLKRRKPAARGGCEKARRSTSKPHTDFHKRDYKESPFVGQGVG